MEPSEPEYVIMGQVLQGGAGQAPARQAANTHHRILGTSDDPLLQTTREGASAYRFDVPDGRYEVELRFVETKHDVPGERVFGVVVNGVAVASALDLAATAGRWHAQALDVSVDAVGGTGVRIELPAAQGESTISAIRVRRTY
jgi:beta-galactosidase